MRTRCFLMLLLVIPIARAQTMTDRDRALATSYGERFVDAINTLFDEERAGVARAIFAEATIEDAGEERLTGLFSRLHEMMGPVTFHHAEVVEVDLGSRISRILHVYVRATTDDAWKDIQLRLAGEPPYKITELGFLADVSEPIYLPNSPVDAPSTLDWLSGYIDALVRDEGLSGAMLIAKGDRVIFERYFGFADSAGTRPVTAGTRFNLGSGNKMFTALAVAHLVEQGRLTFETPIQPFFPEFPGLDGVTIHHLLSHTSGVAEYWTDAYERAWHAIDRLEDMLPFVLAAGIERPAGEAFSYSNSNFILAGLVVERVTGEDYFDVVRSLIYEPLGMTQSDSYRHGEGTPDRAEALVRLPSGAWARADTPGRGSAAGGGYATPRDMLRFVQGLEAGAIVSSQTLQTLRTSKTTGFEAPFQYGYGFILSRDGDVDSYGHGGTARGVNFELRRFPTPDLTLILFSNRDSGAYDDLKRNTIKLISGDR
ncbi:MAG: serine hydrolase domain-containing protein [Rhodothermales bacterium]